MDTTRATHPPSSAGLSDARTSDGRPVPADLAQLGIRPSDVQVISEYCDTVSELLMRSQAEISRWKGLGDPGGERVAIACRRRGFPLGCVPDARARDAPQARPPSRASPADKRRASLAALDAAIATLEAQDA